MEVLAYAEEVWGSRPPADFDAWFAANVDALVQILSVGQVRAVDGTDEYVSGTLDELGTPVDSEFDVAPESFSGVASDGRSLDGLLYGAVVAAGKQVETKGPSAAWGMGLQALQVYMQTQLADASRVATKVAVAARPNTGYVRMLNPPSCSRCAVLAGRWYRWNAAFRRHPGCDCRMVASLADAASDITVDPVKYFDSLSVAEQNKTFTMAGADAIRSGADMGQVVNVRRGATGLDSAAGSTGALQTQDVYGQQLFTSTEGVTKRGVAGKVIRARGRDPRTTPRLMPESIMELAESREDALRLLRLNGYILDRSGPTSGIGSRTSLVPTKISGTVTTKSTIDLDAVAAKKSAAAIKRAETIARRKAQEEQNRAIERTAQRFAAEDQVKKLRERRYEELGGGPTPAKLTFHGDLSSTVRRRVQGQYMTIPAESRAILEALDVRVAAAPNTGLIPGNPSAGRKTADGRDLDDTSFYSPTAKNVYLAITERGSGSVNVVAHESGHALDDGALRRNPVDVSWQDPGESERLFTPLSVYQDPYISWAHSTFVRPNTAVDDYFRNGSEGNARSGRQEWIAEGFAAMVEGDDALLNRISGGIEGADIFKWSMRRLGIL